MARLYFGAGKIERVYKLRCPVCGGEEISFNHFKDYAIKEFRRAGWVARKGLWVHGNCAPELEKIQKERE